MPVLTTDDACRLFYEDTGAGPPLLFIHGWAMSGRVWRYQREAFSCRHRVVSLDLRGHGGALIPATGPGIDDFAADLHALLTGLELTEVIIVAWSMGVSAALRAFPDIRERLAGLVLVGGTPRFTAGDGFSHGLPPDEVRGMALRLRRNYGRTMEEFFQGMFAEGEVASELYGRIVQDIVKGGRLPDPVVAHRSLESLATADLRPLLAAVDIPTLLIHGTEDRICLPEASRFMTEQITGALLELLPGLGHAPFLSRPALFNTLLSNFITSTMTTQVSVSNPESRVPNIESRVPSPESLIPEINRQRVRTSFDRHADEYDCYAQVQRRVVARLLNALAQLNPHPRSLLDIGCGTGRLLHGLAERFPDAELAGIDLAPGMVAATKAALRERDGVTVRVGDAEQLPFPDGSFDLVVSTSTFQWLEQLHSAFAEAYRVLAPGGSFRFALFGARTLYELKESYRTALSRFGRESADRTHRFLPPPAVTAALEQAGFSGTRVWAEDEIDHHADVPTLLRSLKKIGAGNASAKQVQSLAERRTMLTMMQIYEERFGRNGIIPATYEVIYGWGIKKA